MNHKVQGTIMLFMTALIWGSSFIVMKNATDFLTPAILLFIRFTMASIILCLLFFKKIKAFPLKKMDPFTAAYTSYRMGRQKYLRKAIFRKRSYAEQHC